MYQYERVANMLNDGASYEDVRCELGINDNQLWSSITLAKKNGILARYSWQPDFAYKRTAELFNAGTAREEICAELGITKNKLHRLISYCREVGLIDRPVPDPLGSSKGVTFGPLREEIGKLPYEIRKWVSEQLTGEMTVAQFAALCVVDAYHDENDALSQNKTGDT